MNNIEALLSSRWILKREDRDRYYKIKDQIKELRLLFQDKVGFSLVSHPQYIRLDKIPGKSEPWMGILQFQHIEEYQMFCFILAFLEDKEEEEQFILSNMTEYIQLQLEVSEDYWLQFKNRKMFVNVLKYCLKEKLILQNDGNSENFIQDQQSEALFENTGLSRYFMRNFTADVFDWQEPADVMKNEWMSDENIDRGVIRTQRVFRRLLLSCGIYREDDDKNDDFSYIRRYRKRIENDLRQFFPCDLQVYKSSAYLILDDEVRVGQLFPKANALDELVVLCCSHIRKRIKKESYDMDEREIYSEEKEKIMKKLTYVIQKNIAYLPATYRQKSKEQLVDMVYKRMIEIGFMSEEENFVYCYPVIGKLTGEFEEGET